MRFSERERQIFRTHDGREMDPLEIQATIRAASGGLDRFNALLADIDEYARVLAEGPADDLPRADAAAANAELILAKIARAVFGEGLAAIVLDQLYDYLEWMEGKDLPAASGPTSRPVMAEASYPPFSLQGVGITPPSSP